LAYKLLDRQHYLWLVNIAKYNSYEEIKEAMKLIREFNKDTSQKWINNTKLARNRYWILSELLTKYNYNDVLNCLDQIWSK